MTDPMKRAFEGFSLAPPPTPAEPPKSKSVAVRYSDLYTNNAGRISKHLQVCADVVGEIKHGETIHFVTVAGWSTEHLICHVAEQIGPCDLMLATYSASEEAMLRIVTAIENGWIRSIKILFDWRMQVRRPNTMSVLRQSMSSADVRLDACHAKVYLLSNDDWHVSIIGSANLTANARIEASVLTESGDVWEFHHSWLDAIFSDAEPFDRPAANNGK